MDGLMTLMNRFARLSGAMSHLSRVAARDYSGMVLDGCGRGFWPVEWWARGITDIP